MGPIYADASDQALGFLCVCVVFAAIQSAVGALIGQQKGRTMEGAVLGFVLGMIGWVIVLLLSETRPYHRCPHCAGKIAFVGVAKCCHCGSDLRWREWDPRREPDPRLAPVEQESLRAPVGQDTERVHLVPPESLIPSRSDAPAKRITCVGCGHRGSVPPSFAGMTVRCPKCRAKVRA
jgi:hypothetical protein